MKREGEHTHGIRVGEPCGERDLLSLGKRLDEPQGLSEVNKMKRWVSGRSSYYSRDMIHGLAFLWKGQRHTFSLPIVLITSSGGVPRSSVMIENWFTSIKKVVKQKARELDVVPKHPAKQTHCLDDHSWLSPARLTILSGEQRLTLQHLCENTSHTPDID